MSEPNFEKSEEVQAQPGGVAERCQARLRAAELAPGGRHAILTYEIFRDGQTELLEIEVPLAEVSWPLLLLATHRAGRKAKTIQ